MTCATCEASRSVDGVLMCRILAAPANIKDCRWYVYEPGTTDQRGIADGIEQADEATDGTTI